MATKAQLDPIREALRAAGMKLISISPESGFITCASCRGHAIAQMFVVRQDGSTVGGGVTYCKRHALTWARRLTAKFAKVDA